MSNIVNRLTLLSTAIFALCFCQTALAQPVMVVVVGAPGTDEYAAEFDAAAEQISTGASYAGVHVIRISETDEDEITPRDQLENQLALHSIESTDPLWLVMIGHGTFDGQKARFNLRGPDVGASELQEWLQQVSRPLIVINCTSASAPFLNALSGPNRIVVTATQSGYEQNYARFGQFFAAALTAPSHLDKDDQTSLLEAFLYAALQTAEFYGQDERLATEHALIDDNGDQKGTPATFFQGVRVAAAPTGDDLPDGLRAHQVHLIPGERESRMTVEQRAQRDALELRLERLRRSKSQLAEAQYFDQLEEIVAQLAELYQSLEQPPDRWIANPEAEVQPPAPMRRSE